MRKMIKILPCFVLLLAMIIPAAAYAASETDTAAAYLVKRGIYTGDGKGNLNLDKTLTRAELAVILTRLDFIAEPDEWKDWGEAHFSDPENRYNKFTDIPKWALPYIEYCYQRSLMKGVGGNRFDPQGIVSPQMASTVMLRYCRIAETDWNYGTSVVKAQELGIAPKDGMDGDKLLRGTMAVMIYRSMNYAQSNAPSGEAVKPDPILPPQEKPPAGESVTMTIDEMKAEIVRLTNEERVKAGLPALEVLPELMQCAQDKAQDMIDNHYYGHTSPKYGSAEDMIFSRIPEAGTAAENIAAWNKTPEEAFQSWMESTKGHREIILTERLTHIGVGIVKGKDGGYWWVQQFVTL